MMIQKLAATGRSPEIPEELDVYGWLVGSWELDVIHYAVDVREHGIKGSAHFGWVLEGRAIEDVWIMRREGLVHTYGMTFRYYDHNAGAWRVTWTNPVTGRRDELLGRRVGDRIVQLGARADGVAIRWIFSELTPDSFRWTGEALNPDGTTWKLESEFHARRM
ncbi:MAG TPA: hypothetical protein VF618_27210 [Thermoanaerobaculia bacterium]